MAYDEVLARRVRAVLEMEPDLVEKKMFGGVGFLLKGNMACGVNKQDLIVRVGPERYEEALQRANTRPFDMTGRPMRGWVVVTAEGYDSQDDLVGWVRQGAIFAQALPPK